MGVRRPGSRLPATIANLSPNALPRKACGRVALTGSLVGRQPPRRGKAPPGHARPSNLRRWFALCGAVSGREILRRRASLGRAFAVTDGWRILSQAAIRRRSTPRCTVPKQGGPSHGANAGERAATTAPGPRSARRSCPAAGKNGGSVVHRPPRVAEIIKEN
jgi:hypothetical protein